MSETVITNMTMLEVDGKVLVIDRIKKFQGIAFPGGKAEIGETIYDSAIREFKEETGLTLSNLEHKGFLYWQGEEDFKTCKLAPHMEKYLQVFCGPYSECLCTYKNDYMPVYR